MRSNIPFLAGENQVLLYIYELKNMGIEVAFNDIRSSSPMDCLYLPNMYYGEKVNQRRKIPDNYLDIGCFGSIRPMKNQLIQVIGAINYANKVNKILRFHMNLTRIEHGTNEEKNIRTAFLGTKHELVKVPWLSHIDFLNYHNKLDISLQVSLSESFNYVLADAVFMKIPVLGSSEIDFIYKSFPDSGSAESISRLIEKHINDDLMVKFNYNELSNYHVNSVNIWKGYLEKNKIQR